MPHPDNTLSSWNRQPSVAHSDIVDFADRRDHLPEVSPMLPYGNGRSYGDVCLNENGTLLRTRRLDHFIAFDKATGRLTCESGVLLKDILDLIVPHGWFLPVTPGTCFVTVGGAIANDVHGKNHHVQGSFGHHLRAIELLRSDGTRLLCSEQKNSEWLYATIGGLGLTGMILSAELQLMPITNPLMLTKSQRFGHIDEFWALNAEGEAHWPYAVAWIDCSATGQHQGRGILTLGQHATPDATLPTRRETSKTFPMDLPFSLINRLSARAFNNLYFRQPQSEAKKLTHYTPYFYPLDGLRNWNRLYGRKGFFQYQCVIPPENSRDAVRDLLAMVTKSDESSFLAVLKTFGIKPSLGMLSFPRPGATLAIDVPNCGERTLRLLSEMDKVVRQAGGALYPAKDARMSGDMFRSAYPTWEQFTKFIDPKFSSSFWRRVMR